MQGGRTAPTIGGRRTFEVPQQTGRELTSKRIERRGTRNCDHTTCEWPERLHAMRMASRLGVCRRCRSVRLGPQLAQSPCHHDRMHLDAPLGRNGSQFHATGHRLRAQDSPRAPRGPRPFVRGPRFLSVAAGRSAHRRYGTSFTASHPRNEVPAPGPNLPLTQISVIPVVSGMSLSRPCSNASRSPSRVTSSSS